MAMLLHGDKPRLVYFIVILCYELVIAREVGNEFLLLITIILSLTQ